MTNQLFRKIRNLLLTAFASSFALGCSTSMEVANFDKAFKNPGSQGCMLLFDHDSKLQTVYNEELTKVGRLPASTFKIYNSLIALDAGVAKDEKYLILWDGVDREFSAWNQDHTMESAIKYSVVWYYQELARRIGQNDMIKGLSRLEYGNQNIDAGLDLFWLEGGMRITAEEQLELIMRLYDLELPFSKHSQRTVKKMLVLEESENYVLSGKTGTSVRGAGDIISWFVGYVETRDNTYFFVANQELDRSIYTGRYGTAKTAVLDVLKDEGIIY